MKIYPELDTQVALIYLSLKLEKNASDRSE